MQKSRNVKSYLIHTIDDREYRHGVKGVSRVAVSIRIEEQRETMNIISTGDRIPLKSINQEAFV